MAASKSQHCSQPEPVHRRCISHTLLPHPPVTPSCHTSSTTLRFVHHMSRVLLNDHTFCFIYSHQVHNLFQYNQCVLVCIPASTSYAPSLPPSMYSPPTLPSMYPSSPSPPYLSCTSPSPPYLPCTPPPPPHPTFHVSPLVW